MVTRARKGVPVGRRLARFGRPLLAVGLLAALGWAALQGVHRSAGATEQGRLDDRLQVTRAFAASSDVWLQAGVREAAAVAEQAAQVGAGPATASYSARPHTFREAFVVDRSLHRLAGTLRYAASDGSLLACRSGQGAVLDDGLRQLVQAALSTGGPVLRAFDDPSCAPVVAAAATSGTGPVAVAIADRSSLVVRLDALANLQNGRTFVLDANGDAVGQTVAPASDELKAFIAPRRDRSGAGRVPGAALVRAWAPLPGGWTLVVEQGASEFGGTAVTQSSSWFPAAVAACFAFAIVVVGLFDARRRRALARADLDRAAFLAIVGHELRTPLTVLKGFVDTLGARWDALEEGQRLALVERLAPQVRRLHRAVDRLLVAADMQRGGRPRMTEEAVEVNRSLVDVADGFRPVAPLHTLLVEGDPDAVVVADRKALGQVLDQLVDNAIKYSPSGGLVTLAAHRRGSRVEITVEDEGVGLPSDAARIFEAFAQGEDLDRRTHDEGGVGVGLFIARTLVAAMGGTVRAERRQPEPGTRLVVTLKRAPASPAGDGQLVRPGRVHGSS